MAGPCELWAEADELPAACAELSNDAKERGILAATNVLFAMSGSKYTGICTRTFRPKAATGCPRPTIIRLPTRPVREILYVKIDGANLSSDEYEIRDKTFLQRLEDGEGRNEGWPNIQRALPSSEEDTWEVSYTWGLEVPEIGKMAARVLACRIARTLGGDDDCGLSDRARSVVRQGTTFELHDPEALKKMDLVGLAEVDMFLQATNPSKQRIRSDVWSPDIDAGGYTTS